MRASHHGYHHCRRSSRDQELLGRRFPLRPGEVSRRQSQFRCETARLVDKPSTPWRDHSWLRRESKFTNAVHRNRSNDLKINRNYIFQLYAYLMSQTGAGDPIANNAEGVLLFALTEGQVPVESEVEIQSHRLRVMSVDLMGRARQLHAGEEPGGSSIDETHTPRPGRYFTRRRHRGCRPEKLANRASTSSSLINLSTTVAPPRQAGPRHPPTDFAAPCLEATVWPPPC